MRKIKALPAGRQALKDISFFLMKLKNMGII